MVLVALVAGCGGVPRHDARPPPPLVWHGPPIAADQIVVDLYANPWWTATGTDTEFTLDLPAPDDARAVGRSLGPMRSAAVPMTAVAFADARCAWQIVPMGDPRPCAGPRDAAIDAAWPLVEQALADLRAQAGAAGVPRVTAARCFARLVDQQGWLWCEGTASDAVAGPWDRPGAPREGKLDTGAASRLALVADASFGNVGDAWYRGADVGLRYRPVEVTLRMLAFFDDTISLGGAVVGRQRLGTSSTDVLLGLSATASARNGSVNPTFHGTYGVFAGLGAQSRGRWFLGRAQVYASLRAGLAYGDPADGAHRLAPTLELRLGLSTPEP